MQQELIHHTTIVDDGAIIGEGTRIWHFCHVMRGAVIGRHCNIGQNVFIDNNTIIGDAVKIQNNVSVYNGVQLEEKVFIGPSVVFTNVTNPRSFIERKDEFQFTTVRKGASVGANATILCGINIGDYAMIGAGAVVIGDVDSYSIVVGNPARQVGWVSENGTTLTFDQEGIGECGDGSGTYKLNDGKVTKIIAKSALGGR